MSDSSNDTLVQTQTWFLKAAPNPTTKNISTQIGCHLEEVAEMLEELVGTSTEHAEVLNKAIKSVIALSDLMKDNEKAIHLPKWRRIPLLDSLADQIVTATGVGVFLGMNVPGALAEVNRSNYSKFEDGEPVFNENKKVMKGKDYTPPDLTPFI
jgi:predicted HAD superfamily Cof-like phosphohydrolase